MKDRFAVTIHLTNAERFSLEEVAKLQGMSIKAFIEKILPYVASQVKQKSMEKTTCEK